MSGTSNALSNEDFRQFVESTPRSSKDEGEDEIVDISDRKRKRAKAPKYRGKQHQQHFKEDSAKKEQKKKRKYRDRTQEMKAGNNPDYLVDKEIPFAQMDMETSKHLGGDMAHTHMVKGLDFKLLSRIRREQRLEEADKLETANVKNHIREEQRKKLKIEIHFKSVVGRRIHQLLFPESLKRGFGKDRHAGRFLPGRTVFDFNLDPRDLDNIPTTVIRSSEDCPQLEDTHSAKIPMSIISEVKKAFRSHRSGRRSRPKKSHKSSNAAHNSVHPSPEEGAVENGSKHETASRAKSKTLNASEDEEDIFEGIGSYVFKPTIDKSQRSSKRHEERNSSRRSGSSRDATKGPRIHQDRLDRIASMKHKDRDSDRDRKTERNQFQRRSDDREQQRGTDQRDRQSREYSRREYPPRQYPNQEGQHGHSSRARDQRQYPPQESEGDHPARDRRRESPPRLRSIMKKKVINTEELAREAQKNLKRRDKLTLRERIEKEQKDDPFGIAEVNFDDDRKTMTAKMSMGHVSTRTAVDPYGLDFAVGAGIGIDDESDNDEESKATRRRRKFSEGAPSRAAQTRMDKRKVDREWSQIKQLMKKPRP